MHRYLDESGFAIDAVSLPEWQHLSASGTCASLSVPSLPSLATSNPLHYIFQGI